MSHQDLDWTPSNRDRRLDPKGLSQHIRSNAELDSDEEANEQSDGSGAKTEPHHTSHV